MNRAFKAVVSVFILVFGLSGSVIAGPLEDGVAAAGRGDYTAIVSGEVILTLRS
jgi:hypothetical protein